MEENHAKAAECYEKACEKDPSLAPARYALSQVYVMNGQYKEALAHLRTLLSQYPTATDALSLLGLLEVHSGKHIEEGLARLRKATEMDPLNPDLVLLEAYALQQHSVNYPKALVRYEKGVELIQQRRSRLVGGSSAAMSKVPADVYNNMGLLCHEMKRYQDAMKYYRLALFALDEDGDARLVSLSNRGTPGGQIRHHANDVFCDYVNTNLTAKLEEADGIVYLNVENDSQPHGDPFNASDFVVAISDRIRLGTEMYGEVTGVKMNDGRVQIELKPHKSHAASDSSSNEENSGLPLFVMRENLLLHIPQATTIAFNVARLHEATGETIAAIEIHKAIVKRNPVYSNSYSRLACIAFDSGLTGECAKWLTIALSSAVGEGNNEVRALIGNLHVSIADWEAAHKVFNDLLARKVKSVEYYSLLSLASMSLASLDTPKTYAKNLEIATQNFNRILTKEPSNAYAANGLGTVLAERGEILRAKDVFNRVREVSGDSIPDALLNLGHIFLAMKKHPEALQLYTNYLKKAEDTTTPISSKSRADDVMEVLSYIAFTYFDWARLTEVYNDANAAPADGRYKEAMRHLELALSKAVKKESSRYVILQYNLCMTKLQAANCILQKLTRNIPRTVEEVEEALQGLQDGFATVESMLAKKLDTESAEPRKIPIPKSTLQDFLKHCRNNIASAESHLEDEKKRAEETKVERELRRLEAERAMQEAKLRKIVEKEQEDRELEERDRRAEAKMRQVDQLRAGWEQEQIAEQEKKAKRSSGQAKPDHDVAEDPLFDDDDDDNVSVDQAQSKNDAPVIDSGLTNTNELFGDSDEDVNFDENPQKLTTENDLFGDSSEGESDEEIMRAGPKLSASSTAVFDEPLNKKRRILDDEED
jgi:tetratricopeptide (TPR) repeat protein